LPGTLAAERYAPGCTVPFSDIIKAELADHLKRLDQDDQALVFTSPMGTPLRHSNFYRRAWLPAVAKAGLPGIHFHDLRHAGNTLTADAGASLRELMDRMGHSSTRAAPPAQNVSPKREDRCRSNVKTLERRLHV
jgi:integrase